MLLAGLLHIENSNGEKQTRWLHVWNEAHLLSWKEIGMGIGIFPACNVQANVTCIAPSEGPVLIRGFISGRETGQTFRGLPGLIDVFRDEGAQQNQLRWPPFPSTWQLWFLLLFSLGQTSARGDGLGSHYLFFSVLNFLASTHLSSLNIHNKAALQPAMLFSLSCKHFWIIVPFLPKTRFHERMYCWLFRH